MKKIVIAMLSMTFFVSGGQSKPVSQQSEQTNEKSSEKEEEKDQEKKEKQEPKEKKKEETKTTKYEVLQEVVNGVYLHTEPNKEDKSNRRGLLMPGDTIDIVEIVENEDCTWGKTKESQYVCIFESSTDEDKPVGEYMRPVGEVPASKVDTGAYSEVIEDYRKAFASEDVSYIQKYGVQSLEGYSMTPVPNHSKVWSHGYLVEDINGDGVEELIIGYNPDAIPGAGFTYSPIEALYTIKDGKPFYVYGSSGPREHVDLAKDGTIYIHEDTYPTIDLEHYKLQKDSLVHIETTVVEGLPVVGFYRDDNMDAGWAYRMTWFADQ